MIYIDIKYLHNCIKIANYKREKITKYLKQYGSTIAKKLIKTDTIKLNGIVKVSCGRLQETVAVSGGSVLGLGQSVWFTKIIFS